MFSEWTVFAFYLLTALLLCGGVTYTLLKFRESDARLARGAYKDKVNYPVTLDRKGEV